MNDKTRIYFLYLSTLVVAALVCGYFLIPLISPTSPHDVVFDWWKDVSRESIEYNSYDSPSEVADRLASAAERELLDRGETDKSAQSASQIIKTMFFTLSNADAEENHARFTAHVLSSKLKPSQNIAEYLSSQSRNTDNPLEASIRLFQNREAIDRAPLKVAEPFLTAISNETLGPGPVPENFSVDTYIADWLPELPARSTTYEYEMFSYFLPVQVPESNSVGLVLRFSRLSGTEEWYLSAVSVAGQMEDIRKLGSDLYMPPF